MPRSLFMLAASLPAVQNLHRGLLPRWEGSGCFSVLAFSPGQGQSHDPAAAAAQIHHRHVIVVCLSGRVGRRVDGQELPPLKPGEINLLLPYETHHYPLIGEQSRMLVVTFEWRGEDLAALRGRALPLDPALRHDLAAFTACYLKAVPSQSRRCCLLLELVLCALLERSAEIPAVEAAAGPLGLRLAKLMEEDIGRIRSVSDLATACRTTPSALRRHFTKSGLGNAGKFLTQARFQRARHLLISTERSIGEICAFCGFDSVQTFSRNFKRRYGGAPLAYRQAAFRSLSIEHRFRSGMEPH